MSEQILQSTHCNQSLGPSNIFNVSNHSKKDLTTRRICDKGNGSMNNTEHIRRVKEYEQLRHNLAEYMDPRARHKAYTDNNEYDKYISLIPKEMNQ